MVEPSTPAASVDVPSSPYPFTDLGPPQEWVEYVEGGDPQWFDIDVRLGGEVPEAPMLVPDEHPGADADGAGSDPRPDAATGSRHGARGRPSDPSRSPDAAPEPGETGPAEAPRPTTSTTTTPRVSVHPRRSAHDLSGTQARRGAPETAPAAPETAPAARESVGRSSEAAARTWAVTVHGPAGSPARPAAGARSGSEVPAGRRAEPDPRRPVPGAGDHPLPVAPPGPTAWSPDPEPGRPALPPTVSAGPPPAPPGAEAPRPRAVIGTSVASSPRSPRDDIVARPTVSPWPPLPAAPSRDHRPASRASVDVPAVGRAPAPAGADLRWPDLPDLPSRHPLDDRSPSASLAWSGVAHASTDGEAAGAADALVAEQRRR
ncbi:hypothetical protein [Cellulomonas humilata]|uniref:Uncharacterized protein n=1 Tax=Cellulomonas humilata TaxID=144055 RepID=A0ABU0EFG6_9CELL|nr:hypothetical protein [Cellulomonas humilata]MDQ0373838.1 hypothetical protein [Cellulomonas humilata]